MFGNKGEEQPRFPKVWFIWNLIEALLMVAAGGLAIYFGITKDNGNGSTGPIETTIAAVIGAFIILDGILRILMVLFRYKESQESIWLVGGFEITAGIVVILSHEFFVGLIINFLSVFLMVIGGLLISNFKMGTISGDVKADIEKILSDARDPISRTTIIGDLLKEYPAAGDILISLGLGCVGCGSALTESIEQASIVHKLNPKTILEGLKQGLGGVEVDVS